MVEEIRLRIMLVLGLLRGLIGHLSLANNLGYTNGIKLVGHENGSRQSVCSPFQASIPFLHSSRDI